MFIISKDYRPIIGDVVRTLRMRTAKARGMKFSDIGALFGVSGSRVSQLIKRAQHQERLSVKRLNQFKAEECAREIQNIKEFYDALPAECQVSRKDVLAGQIDDLLMHMRDARNRADAIY